MDRIKMEDTMAAKKSAKKPRSASPKEVAAIRKGVKDIQTAHKHLQLLLKKHVQRVSPMFFAI
jgi:hypothetical protein